MADRTSQAQQGMTRRLQEVAPSEYAEEVYTRSAWDSAVSLGRAFIATSAKIPVSGTSPNIRGLISNPAGSGQLIVIMRLVAYIGPSQFVQGSLYLNPTTGLPSTTYTPFNLKALAGGTDSCAASFSVDAGLTALAGGTATELRVSGFQARAATTTTSGCPSPQAPPSASTSPSAPSRQARGHSPST